MLFVGTCRFLPFHSERTDVWGSGRNGASRHLRAALNGGVVLLLLQIVKLQQAIQETKDAKAAV